MAQSNADFIQSVASVSDVGTTFDVNKKVAITLPSRFRGKEFLGSLHGLWVYMDKDSGSPAVMTMRLTSDSDGDVQIITDTQSAIYYGVSTATKGAALWNINLDIATDDNVIYLYCKVDQGTVDITSVKLIYK